MCKDFIREKAYIKENKDGAGKCRERYETKMQIDPK